MGEVVQALVGKELSDLTAIVRERGEPSYRARQIYHGLYRLGLSDLAGIPSLPAGLRADLARDFEAGLPMVSERFVSVDGTVRYLLGLADGKTVEAVFIPEEQRDTLCISTQVGCPVDCKFCLTALLGLERNLTAGEIVGQVLRLFGEHGLDPRKRPVNIVMMGMGEPLLNLEAVLKATRLLADEDGIGIPLRRITVSTSGVIPKIDEMAREPQRPRLAVSLNASTEEMRRELMPITQKYHLEELLEACRRYPLRPWERLSFEYVLLAGVNDSDEDARRVVRLLARINCKVNLIAFNPGPEMPFETPSPERVVSFQAVLRRSFPCFVRKPRGREIYAACGQLKRASGSE
jgi:23S rRNA (adenine2503-C2)-methyltransferase